MDDTKAHALIAGFELLDARTVFPDVPAAVREVLAFAAEVRRDEREACRRAVVALHTNRPPDWTNYHPFIRDGHTRALSEAESAIALSPQAGPDPTVAPAEKPDFPPWSREMSTLVRLIADYLPVPSWGYNQDVKFSAAVRAAFPETPDAG